MNESTTTTAGRWRRAISAVRRRCPSRETLLLIIPIVAWACMPRWMGASGLRTVITPDSVAYIESGRWFAQGQGLSLGEPGALRPMTHWAPLYPVALGAGVMFGITAEDMALVINCLSLGFTLLFTGLIVWRLSRSVWAGVAAQVICGFAWKFIQLHFYALSEPLFLALMTGGIWALIEYRLRARLVWLLLAAELLSLSVMCRYAGLGIVLGVLIYLAWSSPRKLRDTLVMLAVTLGPFALWVGAHQADAHWGIAREVAFEAPSVDLLMRGICTLGAFVLPGANPLVACVLGLGALGALIAAAAFRRTRLLGCVGCGYIVFLLLSRAFGDHGLLFDERILTPAALALLMIATVMAVEAVRSQRWWVNRMRVIVVAVVCLSLCGNLNPSSTASAMGWYARWGHGFERIRPAESPVLTKLMQLPARVVTICGQPEALHYLTGRAGLGGPRTGEDWTDFWLRQIAEPLREHKLVFVNLEALNGYPPGEFERRLRSRFDLEPLAQERDGNLYWVVERPPRAPRIVCAGPAADDE